VVPMAKKTHPEPKSLKRRRRRGAVPIGGKEIEAELQRDLERQQDPDEAPASSMAGLIRRYEKIVDDPSVSIRETLQAMGRLQEIRKDEEQVFQDVRHWPTEKLMDAMNRTRYQLMRLGVAMTRPFIRCSSCSARIDVKKYLKDCMDGKAI
jgi:hypothetical protein